MFRQVVLRQAVPRQATQSKTMPHALRIDSVCNKNTDQLETVGSYVNFLVIFRQILRTDKLLFIYEILYLNMHFLIKDKAVSPIFYAIRDFGPIVKKHKNL